MHRQRWGRLEFEGKFACQLTRQVPHQQTELEQRNPSGDNGTSTTWKYSVHGVQRKFPVSLLLLNSRDQGSSGPWHDGIPVRNGPVSSFSTFGTEKTQLPNKLLGLYGPFPQAEISPASGGFWPGGCQKLFRRLTGQMLWLIAFASLPNLFYGVQVGVRSTSTIKTDSK
jgi:hypothetical protein